MVQQRIFVLEITLVLVHIFHTLFTSKQNKQYFVENFYLNEKLLYDTLIKIIF